MKWLDLEIIKAQCRIEQDFHDEDKILELYGNSVETTILNQIGRSFEDLMESYGEVPPDIIHASLLLVDQAYRQRSPADTMSWAPVPYAYDMKIKPYMRLASKNVNENENRYGCKKL
jgi:hypothetical protein